MCSMRSHQGLARLRRDDRYLARRTSPSFFAAEKLHPHTATCNLALAEVQTQMLRASADNSIQLDPHTSGGCVTAQCIEYSTLQQGTDEMPHLHCSDRSSPGVSVSQCLSLFNTSTPGFFFLVRCLPQEKGPCRIHREARAVLR